MTRHISDLSWKVDALKIRKKGRSESISSAPDANKDVMYSSQSTASLKTNAARCMDYSLGSTPDSLSNSNNVLDIPSSDGSESNITS